MKIIQLGHLCLGQCVSGSDAVEQPEELQRSPQRALRLVGFVHASGNIHEPHEMECMVSAQQTFPHAGTPLCGLPPQRQGKHQGVRAAPAVRGAVCAGSPSPLYRLSSLLCASVPFPTQAHLRPLCGLPQRQGSTLEWSELSSRHVRGGVCVGSPSPLCSVSRLCSVLYPSRTSALPAGAP